MAPRKTKHIINRDLDFVVKSEAQRQMMEADFDNVSEVLMTGPGGTGKSQSLIISSMGPQRDGSFLTDNKDYVGLILRRESTQLEKSGLIRNALEWYRKFYPTLEYNGSLKRVTFPSGAVISFGGCESEQDCYKYKGFSKLHGLFLEEGTQYTQLQLDILTTRLRDANNKMPLRVRITTNAGENEEPLLQRYKYWLWKASFDPLDTDLKVSYGTKLYRYVDEQSPDLPLVVTSVKPRVAHESFMCIETKVNDIMENNLQTLGKITDPIIREQLMNHRWGLKAGSGMYFASNDLFEAHQRPSSATRIRYWDKACSGESGDFLCGMLVSHSIEGQSKFLIEDVILAKIEAPKVKDLIIKTAQADGKNVYIGFEQEPGSSGKELMDIYKRELEQMHFRVIVDAKKESKLNRAQFISPLAKENRIGFIHCQSTNEMMKQLINFPSKGVHDDCVDALSGSIILLSNHLPRPSTYIGPKKDMTSVYLQMEDIRGTPSVFR